MPGELWDDPDDAPTEELLTSARDRASLDERLAERAHRGFSWARRHRGLVGSAAVVLLVGATVAVYLARRPPPVSPVVAATFELSSTGGNQYVVELATPGEEIHPIGVVGPGLVDPTSTVPRVTATGPGLGTLGATVDCGDQTWWEATADDYGVQVTRTDPYGRTTTNVVPFSRSTEWWSNVRLQWLGHYLRMAGPVTADVSDTVTGPDGGTVEVVVHLTNPGDRDLRVGIDRLGTQAGLSWDSVPLQDLQSRGELALGIPFVVDCRAGEPHLPVIETDGPLSGPILLSVTTAADTSGDGRVMVALDLTDESYDTVSRGLRGVCPSTVRTG